MMDESAVTLERIVALAVFSRRFSTLCDMGMSLASMLTVLGADAPEPYAAAADALYRDVMDDHPLSEAMGRRPELFSPFYTRLVRVGEIGGILEIALACLADLAEEGLIAARTSGPGEAVDWPWAPSASVAPAQWADLSPTRRVFCLMAFTWSLGVMVGAGVPVPIALETAADLLPSQEQAAVHAAASGDLSAGIAGPLKAAGFLPDMVIESLDLADHHGSLDRVLGRLADCFRHEYRCRLAGQ